MAHARIGKLFHLTPLVDDLGDAEYFFNSVFSPLCMMRNYSEHWHRHAAIYIIAETSIEPMHCLAPEPGQEATSWFRYAEKYGPRVHNIAFYVDDLDDLGQRLEAAGVRVTDARLGEHVVLPPEGHSGHARVPSRRRPLAGPGPSVPARVERIPRRVLGAAPPARGAAGLAHHRRRRRSPRRREVLRRRARRECRSPTRTPPSPAGIARYVVVGEDTIVELLAPGDTDSVHARDLARVGPSVTGLTFTVRDVPQAATALEYHQEFLAARHRARDRVRRRQDLGLRVPAHRPGAHGRPARVIASAIVGANVATQSRVAIGDAHARRRRR